MGAILAGGRSSRFGSDKALADVGGKPLIAHVADALHRHCASVVVCGRAWGKLPGLDDRPGPGLGPMAGLAAALWQARTQGFDAVLCAPCDVLDLPADLATRLAPGPSVIEGQWLVGLWPAELADRLQTLLLGEGAISARRWIEASGAAVVAAPAITNINRPGDIPA